MKSEQFAAKARRVGDSDTQLGNDRLQSRDGKPVFCTWIHLAEDSWLTSSLTRKIRGGTAQNLLTTLNYFHEFARIYVDNNAVSALVLKIQQVFDSFLNPQSETLYLSSSRNINKR